MRPIRCEYVSKVLSLHCTMKKLRVGVLFGGRSGEHEVSLLSAASVLNAIDKKKYDVVPIGITKEGRWVTPSHAERLLKGESRRVTEPRHLRAGDPEATSAAAVLAKGEGVVVPPMPGANHSSLMPFETSAHEMHAAAKSDRRRHHLPGSARHLRRGRNHPGAAGARRYRLRRRGRAGLCRGHGQRCDEEALP